MVAPPPAPARPEDQLRTGGSDAALAAARRAATVLAAGAEAHDRAGSYAPENIEAIWAEGLGNLQLPARLGGVGADLKTVAGVVEILAGADPSTALILVMHYCHLRAATQGTSPWPSGVRDRVVADSLAGPALINTLRVEPELGTPSRGGVPTTTAVPGTGPDGRPVWRICGRKIYSTGSYGLRWMAVSAATPADDPDGHRIGTFLVPAPAPGIEIVETWDHLGMRASASHDVVLRDVEVPLDHAVGLSAVGSSPARADTASVGWMTILLLALYRGVVKAGRDWLADYLNTRVPTNLGAPLSSLPRFQAAMGEIEALVLTAEQLVSGLAADVDAGGQAEADALARAGLVKVVVTGNVIRALELGLSLIGNPGLSYHHPLQRHYRNALCSRIHTPQDDVVLTAAGRQVLAGAAQP